MALPKIDIPTYTLKLPSTGEELVVRPFLVKEEKLLLLAAESKDEEEIIRTTKQIITNCVISGDIDVDKLPFFDIDYLFIALRAKSIGESVDMRYTCNGIDEETGNQCGNKFDAKIDIGNVEVIYYNGTEKEIALSGGVKLYMKYPTYALMKAVAVENMPIEKKIVIMSGSIEKIVEKSSVYTSKDFTRDELKVFIEGLTQEDFKKLEKFVDAFPSFVVLSESKCNKCGFDHKIRYDDFSSFFF